MKDSITFECRKCGKKFVVSEKGEKRLAPLYCCGAAPVKIRKKKSPVKGKKT